jgi:hypothetical protein
MTPTRTSNPVYTAAVVATIQDVLTTGAATTDAGSAVAAGSVGPVKGEINLTRAGLHNAAQHGISPAEIWEIVDAHERVIMPVGVASRLILGFTAAGRGVAVLGAGKPAGGRCLGRGRCSGPD